jgi:type II secretory pathway pseudopilin PulG
MSAERSLSSGQVVITVIILGILARTVAPQFVEARSKAKICELAEGLEVMRAHLDWYRAEQHGRLPATSSFLSFERAMTQKAGEYDPHIAEIPVNPFNGLRTVRFDGEAAGAGLAGWRLDTESGLFQADNDSVHAAL